jgi:hypothetical protein
VSLVFPTPEGNFSIAIIDGAMQIQKLSLSFELLARNHLIWLEFFFHDIPNCHGLLPKIPIQRPILGQTIPKIIFLLPHHNVPVMNKTNMPIPGLRESISLNGRRNDATTRRGGRSYHPDIIDLSRRSGRG